MNINAFRLVLRTIIETVAYLGSDDAVIAKESRLISRPELIEKCVRVERYTYMDRLCSDEIGVEQCDLHLNRAIIPP
jgi:hypothetical protein